MAPSLRRDIPTSFFDLRRDVPTSFAQIIIYTTFIGDKRAL